MKSNPFFIGAVVGAALLSSCSQATPDKAVAPAAESAQDLVKRGEYLVGISGCNDCHSPKIMTDQGPAPDPKRLLSGHPAETQLPALSDPKIVSSGQWVVFSPSLTAAIGPWGTTYAANLTPDDTGLGSWSLEQFKKALREGKSKGLEGGRMLLPPMPWQNYVNMKDEDAAAIFAYLKSIPPVSNVVPVPVPPSAAK